MAPADGLTHLQAVEREGVLADELVVGCGVVVFDEEAHQRQLWHVHVELEVFVPRRVETSKKGEKLWQNGRNRDPKDTAF